MLTNAYNESYNQVQITEYYAHFHAGYQTVESYILLPFRFECHTLHCHKI